MFNTTRLQDNRIIVTGTDTRGIANTLVVDGSQWIELKGDDSLAQAQAEFDKANREFYAPLTKATDALKAARAGKVDSLNFMVVQEKVKGTAGRDEIIVHLTHDSKILRLIDEDPEAPRLIWVYTGDKVSLEILAEAAAPQKTAGIDPDSLVIAQGSGNVSENGVVTADK